MKTLIKQIQNISLLLFDFIKSYQNMKTEFSRNPSTCFSPMFHFYTPRKYQKTKGFPTFSGAIEMKHWTKMSLDLYKLEDTLQYFIPFNQLNPD